MLVGLLFIVCIQLSSFVTVGSVQSLDWNGGMDWWTGLMSQQIMEKRNRVA